VSIIVEELPQEFFPVEPFVEECLEKVGQDGFVFLGERGGYVSTKDLNPSKKPTAGDSVYYAGSDLVVPYWHYLKSPNKCYDCEFGSKRPTLGDIENNVAAYIEENLRDCLERFRPIESLGFDVKERGDMEARVIITDQNVVVTLKYPLAVSKEDTKFEIDNFYVSLPLDFGNIYRMADYISRLEQEVRFLEGHTMNLLVIYMGADEKLLPPISRLTFELEPGKTWKRSKVKEDVVSILSSYVSLIRIVNTLNYKDIITDSLMQDGFYNMGMTIPNDIPGLEVNFDYLDFWDVYFDINCRGDVCQAEEFINDWLPIGLHRYNFVYQLSYPVVVEIHDPDAFLGRGYSFQFFLESNIRYNRPLYGDIEPLIGFVEQHSTMVCDEDQRTSAPVYMRVKDGDELVSDVNVYYTCIEGCHLGKTVDGTLETGMPICVNGVLSFRKEGYTTVDIPFDASLDSTDSVKVEMKRINQVTVQAKKKVIYKDNGIWKMRGEEELEDYESALISINQGKSLDMVELKKGETAELNLAEGKYDLEISYISDEIYMIPKRVVKGGDEKYQQPEANLSIVTWIETEAEYNGEEILTFYVLAPDVYDKPIADRTIEDVPTDFEALEDQFWQELIPK